MNIIMRKELKSAGYTLIEMLAVVTITAIMSVIFIVNYGATKKNIILNQAAQQLVLDLRRAQNMAMTTVKFGGQIPQGGYGINIGVSSPGAYIIYADSDGNKVYTGAAEKFGDRAFDSNINIASASASDINFTPPNPAITITPSASSATITLRYGVGAAKIITINGITGQISVD